MSMRFAYRMIPVAHPTITLRGQRVRPRPIVNLSIVGPGGSVVRDALLDTGSDEIILDAADAVPLGIDLTTAPSNQAAGVGSPTFEVRYASVELRLTDGQEYRAWPAVLGFTTARLHQVLFGFAHGLQYFTTTFHGDPAAVELTINARYPGT